MIRQIERAKAHTCGKVEHPFRVIKCQFDYTKVRFRGLVKSSAQLVSLFALSNLWMMTFPGRGCVKSTLRTLLAHSAISAAP